MSPASGATAVGPQWPVAGASKGSRASQAGLAPLGTTKEVLGFIIDFLNFDLDFLGSPILLLGFPRIS